MLCPGIFGCSVSTFSNFVEIVLDNAAPTPPPIAAAVTVIRPDLNDSLLTMTLRIDVYNPAITPDNTISFVLIGFNIFFKLSAVNFAFCLSSGSSDFDFSINYVF